MGSGEIPAGPGMRLPPRKREGISRASEAPHPAMLRPTDAGVPQG